MSRRSGVFELSDEERVNWHFIPKAREGIRLRNLTTAHGRWRPALLSSGVGQRGYAERPRDHHGLGRFFLELEAGRRPKRDNPENYFCFDFWEPGSERLAVGASKRASICR